MAFKGVDSLISKKAFSNLGIKPGSLVGPAAMAGMSVMDYRANVNEGYSPLSSAAKTAGEFVVMDVLGWKKYLAMQMLTGIPKTVIKGYEGLMQQARSMSKMSNAAPFQNAAFNDTQQAFTMRQAGMQMAQASKYNLQQALLGNEAQYMHR